MKRFSSFFPPPERGFSCKIKPIGLTFRNATVRVRAVGILFIAKRLQRPNPWTFKRKRRNSSISISSLIEMCLHVCLELTVCLHCLMVLCPLDISHDVNSKLGNVCFPTWAEKVVSCASKKTKHKPKAK